MHESGMAPSLNHMTRLERNVNITAVVLPFLVVAAAVPLLWGRLIGPSDLIVFAVMYVVCGLGVTVGYRRMCHRAFQAIVPRVTCSPSWARWRSRDRSSSGSPTTASTTPTPTRKAIHTHPTSATGRECGARSGGFGTPTWAGCGAPMAGAGLQVRP